MCQRSGASSRRRGGLTPPTSQPRSLHVYVYALFWFRSSRDSAVHLSFCLYRSYRTWYYIKSCYSLKRTFRGRHMCGGVTSPTLDLRRMCKWLKAGGGALKRQAHVPCSDIPPWSCCSRRQSPSQSGRNTGHMSCVPTSPVGTAGRSWVQRHAR